MSLIVALNSKEVASTNKVASRRSRCNAESGLLLLDSCFPTLKQLVHIGTPYSLNCAFCALQNEQFTIALQRVPLAPDLTGAPKASEDLFYFQASFWTCGERSPLGAG